MTLTAWIGKVNGKFIDVDNFPKNNPYQCVDLMRNYCVDVLRLKLFTIPPTDYAKNIWKNAPNKNEYFVKVKNVWSDLNCKPSPGDLVFWDFFPGVTGWAGHVGICTYADGKSIIVMNQNYPNGTPSQLRKFSYLGVMGWLKPKV